MWVGGSYFYFYLGGWFLLLFLCGWVVFTFIFMWVGGSYFHFYVGGWFLLFSPFTSNLYSGGWLVGLCHLAQAPVVTKLPAFMQRSKPVSTGFDP